MTFRFEAPSFVLLETKGLKCAQKQSKAKRAKCRRIGTDVDRIYFPIIEKFEISMAQKNFKIIWSNRFSLRIVHRFVGIVIKERDSRFND